MAKQKEKPSKELKSVQVQLIPSLNPKLGRVYSNFIEVSHSPWDFTLRFCDAPSGGDIPRLTKGSKGGQIEIPSIVEIVIPVVLMPGLIRALTDQNEKYVKAYKKTGEINGKNK